MLLLLVDTDDNIRSLQELNHFCFLNDLTLLLAWSREEAARYIETLKAYEKKSPESIQERVEKEFGTRCIFHSFSYVHVLTRQYTLSKHLNIIYVQQYLSYNLC